MKYGDPSDDIEQSEKWISATWEARDNWSGFWARCTLADGRVGTGVDRHPLDAKRAAFTEASRKPVTCGGAVGRRH